MVPQQKTPEEPPRSFSPEVQASLLLALRDITRSDTDVPDGLRDALQRAAREARERQLQPEELLVAFKSLEEQVTEEVRPGPLNRDRFRPRLIRTLLEAYYGR